MNDWYAYDLKLIVLSKYFMDRKLIAVRIRGSQKKYEFRMLKIFSKLKNLKNLSPEENFFKYFK